MYFLSVNSNALFSGDALGQEYCIFCNCLLNQLIFLIWQARNAKTKEVVAIKKMSFQGKQSSDVSQLYYFHCFLLGLVRFYCYAISRLLDTSKTTLAMFCRTQCLSNFFPVDTVIISLFDVESQIFITTATSASLWQISVTQLHYPPTKTHCLVQDSPLYLFCKPSERQLSVNVPTFLLPWQGLVWDKFQ